MFLDNFSSPTALVSGSEFIGILRNSVKVDGDEDLESEDLIIQFDFEAIKTKKCFKSKGGKDNQISFKGSALLHKEATNTRKRSTGIQFNDDYSFEYNALLHKKSKEILIEPLVETYLNLKWQSLKGWWYGYRLVFFIAFGVCLTLMMSFIVEMNNHCKYAELKDKTIESEGEFVKKNQFKKAIALFISTRILKSLV